MFRDIPEGGIFDDIKFYIKCVCFHIEILSECHSILAYIVQVNRGSSTGVQFPGGSVAVISVSANEKDSLAIKLNFFTTSSGQ